MREKVLTAAGMCLIATVWILAITSYIQHIIWCAKNDEIFWMIAGMVFMPGGIIHGFIRIFF
jgi:hypothetical protein